MDSRKELKFLLGEQELFLIETKIRSILEKDPHQTGDSYLIRSVYFDSPERTCFRENAAGVDKRRKYRIRTYNNSDALIRAEIKSKYRDTIHKDSAALTREQYEAMMSGCIEPADTTHEFAYKILGEGYRPSCIVEYERSAYFYGPCNVRVTFDKNIRASSDFERFFDKDLPTVPACEPGKHILEVKYDEFLPEFLAQILQTGTLRRTSFSKFYQCELALRS